ncbi:Unconventional myosin-IXa [Toxocara canis]|uniref:Unconventional myosin-IXa n=1 Tax=Toxocara canis TaxID=6265 RepID=A0A0B2UP64_TOXCA|nr:Unconventional myosin-IXa [Toxocara canis]
MNFSEISCSGSPRTTPLYSTLSPFTSNLRKIYSETVNKSRHKGTRPLVAGVRLGSTEASSTIDSFLAKFLTQPQDREYADLCMLPELTEQTMLDNLRDRFKSGHIYTYIGE